MASFEDRMTALEAVVERLERGELSLDESVRLFEEGIQLTNSCKSELERAEGRIQVLVESQSAGFQSAGFQVADLEIDDDELREDDDSDQAPGET